MTREGIRDNVDWQGHGFEFCGEASDGEMALQLLVNAAAWACDCCHGSGYLECPFGGGLARLA